MKNELDDLLNNVFGSRMPRTGAKSPDAEKGAQKNAVPQLTLTPDNTPQARRAANAAAASRRGAAGTEIGRAHV